MKKMFPLALLLFVILSCVYLQPARAQTTQSSEADEISINLRSTDGRMYNLEQMRGNVVLVSFGATWCQPCADELRILEQLQKEYEDKPVKFLWVSIEGQDEVSDGDLRKYAKKLKLSFPVLRDPTKFTFAQFSDVVRIPLVAIFNKDGALVVKQRGMAAPEEYKTFIRQRLDKFLSPAAATRPRLTKTE